ncbi:TonB-dependent receptor [Chitinophaga nivalis]|uniref:TonB-dependent receptor n=1 Tax=Chitinophaga nivalis TaxID=2991709 RepID=A0ABT3IIB8_9BACT|nr:TonB-dependent receptor [Chitinophaga nivalis]MCW3466596.1 TonB-dependent receptor [Chitinophaga nivalis]MCW3483713.1 TonB-dependent receptor [Chitinophaga nivalis]
MTPFVLRWLQSMVLSIGFMLLPGASLLYAQHYQELQQSVHLTTGKQQVSDVLKSLQEQQGKYRYLYDPAQVAELDMNIIKPEMPLSEVLQQMDQRLPLEVELKENIIVIRKGALLKTAMGVVQGKIFNDQNEPVPGVTIVVPAANRYTSSKVDGSYTLQLPEGTYNLSFRHLGFRSSSANNVVVKEGRAAIQDVVMSSTSATLQGVTVKGAVKKESVATLYNKQRNAAGLTDGISAEQITRSPDKNVGEVLKRISGLATVDNKYVVVRGMSERYNAAMLNGQIMPSTELNRKNFSYDIIPASIIDNITVLKTITPDMSAEFGGGLVNVETKAIPTQSFLNVSVGGSFNDNTTGKPFNSLKLDQEYLGRPSSHRNLFGTLNWKSMKDILAKTDGPHSNDGADMKYPVKDPSVFSNNWGIYKFNAQPSMNLQVSWGKVLNLASGNQLGFIASASYRNTLHTQDVRMLRDGYASMGLRGDGKDSLAFNGKQYGFSTNIGWMAGVGYTSSRNKLSLQTLYLNTLDQQLLLGRGVDGTSSVQVPVMGYYDNTQWTRLWQTQFKGEHSVGNKGVRLHWMGTYVKLDRQRPDNHMMRIQVPEESVTTDPYTAIGPPQARGVDGAMRWWTRAFENDLNWDMNVAVPFHFNIKGMAVANTFKVGYAGWYKDRLFYVARVGTGGSSAVPQSIQSFFDPSKPGFTFSFDQFSDDFHRSAALHALYGMFDTKLAGKLRLVWGVRAEYYNLNKINEVLDEFVKGAEQYVGPNKGYDLSSFYNREKNWKIFPSANLTYNLSEKMNLRLAYAQSIIRPDLRELSFFREYDFELGGEYRSIEPITSSALKHLDFRYEYYPGPGEIMSVSLFYKKIDLPMEISAEPSINTFSLHNNKVAENKGIEVEIRKSLRFTKIPVVKNFTLYANGTMLLSRVKALSPVSYKEDPPGSKKIVIQQSVGDWEDRPQQGASNYTVNAGVYYDTRWISASLLYNYVTNRLFMPHEVYATSLFERPVQALDGQIGVKLLKDKMQLRVNVSNLLNSYSTIYYNSYDNGNTEPANGRKPTRGELLYQKDKDIIFYQIKPGRTYSFTLGYNF